MVTGHEQTAQQDDGLAEAKHAAMLWNTPLSEPHAEVLLDRLELPDAGSILDLGATHAWGGSVGAGHSVV